MVKLRIAVAMAVAIVAAALPVAAGATIQNYWGFNYLGPNNPSVGDPKNCTNFAGWACSGWNYYDISRVQNNSTGSFNLGFWAYDGSAIGDVKSGSGTFNEYRTDINNRFPDDPINAYNHLWCAHNGNSVNYLQCRGVTGA
jgi:hypothetical protein